MPGHPHTTLALTGAATELLHLIAAADLGAGAAFTYTSHGRYQLTSRRGRDFARRTFAALQDAQMVTGADQLRHGDGLSLDTPPLLIQITETGRTQAAQPPATRPTPSPNPGSPAARRLLSAIAALSAPTLIHVQPGHRWSLGYRGITARPETYYALAEAGLIALEDTVIHGRRVSATEAGRQPRTR